MKTIKILLCICFIFSTSFCFAQTNIWFSTRNTVVVANGNAVSDSKVKNYWFYKNPDRITLMDTEPNKGNTGNFYEVRDIYKTEFKEDGTVNFWTEDDFGQNSPIVLFKLDLNSSPSTMTVIRYSNSNNVVKKTIYYLD